MVVIHSFWLASQTTPIFRTLAFGAIACRSVSSCASLLFHYLRLIGECPKNKGFLSLFKVPNSFPLLIASGLSVRVTTYFCLEAWARPTDVSRKLLRVQNLRNHPSLAEEGPSPIGYSNTFARMMGSLTGMLFALGMELYSAADLLTSS